MGIKKLKIKAFEKFINDFTWVNEADKFFIQRRDLIFS